MYIKAGGGNSGSEGGGHTIVGPFGSEMTQRSKLQFKNAEVTDDSANDMTIVDPSVIPHRTMTVKLDLTDSNPLTWATYADDADGMIAGSADWDNFFGHYPCILQNGVELGKLNPNDFSKYADGSAAPITTLGNDVMIAFPKRGIKLSIDSGILTVSMTDEENKAGYSYMAHSYKGDACDIFYLGKYKGYVSDSKLYSVSGQTPTANQNIGTFRTQAQARGTGYEQSGFFQLTFRQVMYLLKYKGQNAQIAVGRGFVDGNSAIYGAAGYTNDKGMDWGETTGKLPMCLFGLEDFYGNIYEFIDGIYADSNRQLKVADGNFNDTGNGYTDAGTQAFSSNISGYMQTPNGTNLAGFSPASQTYGSATTYFCDSAFVNAGRLAYFGGDWGNAGLAGVFPLYVSRTASSSSASVGARLMYLHKAA